MSETLINQNQIASGEWVKPSSWIDIRSGAIPNSIYFLVGHAADFSKYPNFKINATVSTAANMYDVFVDGVKQATTASGSDTLLNWQTLNLASGFSTTYPEVLKTHIVRVTPSTSTDTFTAFKTVEVNDEVQGALWMHVTASNAIDYEDCMGEFNATRGKMLEAVTSSNKTLKGTSFASTFFNCQKLKYVPTIEGLSGQDTVIDNIFRETKVKTIRLKNIESSLYGFAYNDTELEYIFTENCKLQFPYYGFTFCSKLKNLPEFIGFHRWGVLDPLPANGQLTDCILDFSASETTTITEQTLFKLGGDSSNTFRYIKGIIFNSSFTLTNPSGESVDVGYTGMDRAALVTLFNSLPTVTGDIVCNVTGATGASDLTSSDLAIAQNKGWTVTR